MTSVGSPRARRAQASGAAGRKRSKSPAVLDVVLAERGRRRGATIVSFYPRSVKAAGAMIDHGLGDGMRSDGHNDMHGRVCLVTGGASGIGWAISCELAAQGAVVHVADMSAEHLLEAQAHADRAGQDIAFTELDVVDVAGLRTWIIDVHDRCGRIDVLVNNAAFVRWSDVEEMTVAEAERTMRSGYDAMVHGVEAVLPLMRAAGGGHIVSMGSSVGEVIVKGPSAAYAATKAAIGAYTTILRLELDGSAIAVTLVRPGTVIGYGLPQQARAVIALAEARRLLADHHPGEGRRCGRLCHPH